MNYFKVMKNGKMIGIGNSDSNIPKNDAIFKYIEITKVEYNKLNREEFTPKK